MFENNLEDISPFLWGLLIALFGLLVTGCICPGFQRQVDPLAMVDACA